MRTRDDEFSDAPLTPTETQELRRIIQAEGRVKWLWALLRSVALWLTAVIGGVYIFWDALSKIVKALAR